MNIDAKRLSGIYPIYINMYRHTKNVIGSGAPAREATHALIMLHGRGASATSIIDLADHFDLNEIAIFAPQAVNNSWYPFSFMVPEEQNQPALNSALAIIDELIRDIINFGIPMEKIFFLGFSQGACLALEYVTRNAARYGGVVIFTGGLIGDKLNLAKYSGDFDGTCILITTGDPDPHVPLARVEESVNVLTNLHAKVTLKVFKERPHTVSMEEIKLAKKLFI